MSSYVPYDSARRQWSGRPTTSVPRPSGRRTSFERELSPALSSLPLADEHIAHGVLERPRVPPLAHGADGRRRVPPQHVRRHGAPHVALHRRLRHQPWGLREAEGEGDAISFIELGGLLENAGKDFVGEVVELHWMIRQGVGGLVLATKAENRCWLAVEVQAGETKGGKGGKVGGAGGFISSTRTKLGGPFEAP